MLSVNQMPTALELAKSYLHAKRIVVSCGHASEIAWQARVVLDDVSVESFIREASWVILSSGMRESVVAKRFPLVVDAMKLDDPKWTVANRQLAHRRGMRVFGHKAKIDAIIDVGELALSLGDLGLRGRLRMPESFLRSLPYIGPVTWKHLAKNIGLPVAKDDRHLQRLAVRAGRSSVDNMCSEIADLVGDPVHVVDLVLWRWSVVHAVCRWRHCKGLPHLEAQSVLSLP